MSSATFASPEAVKPLSQIERVADTFLAPTKTFTDIRRNASWWLPFVLIALSWIVLVYVVDSKVGIETTTQNAMQLSPKGQARMDQLPADQRAQQMAMAVKFNRFIWYGSPIFAIILGVIMAAIMLATFNFGFGQELKFSQCMAMYMYPSLPLILKFLLAILAVVVGGGEGFMFQNPLASNLTPLVSPSSNVLYGLATALDIFTIWTLILAGIGYACITKLKRGTCLAVVFGWWIVFTAVMTGLSAMFA